MTTKICLEVAMVRLINLPKNYKKLSFILIFLFASISGYTKGKSDVLLHMAQAKEATINYLDTDITLAAKYAYLHLKLATENANKAEMGDAYHQLGKVYKRKNEIYIALENYLKALHIKHLLKDDVGVAKTANNIGNLYMQMALYPIAINYYQQALDIFAKENNVEALAHIYRNIGISYSKIGNYTKALENYEKSLTLSQQINNLESILVLYDDMAIVKRELGLYDEAIVYYQKMLNPKYMHKDEHLFLYTYNNLGDIYKLKKDYKKSLSYLEKALAIVNAKEILEEVTYTIHNNLGEIYLAQKDYQKAIAYFKTNENLGIEVEGVEKELIFSYQKLTSIYKTLHELPHADHYEAKKIALETLVESRKANFQQLRQTQLQIVEKSVEDFKTAQTSFTFSFANPLHIGFLVLLLGVLGSITYYYLPFSRLQFQSVDKVHTIENNTNQAGYTPRLDKNTAILDAEDKNERIQKEVTQEKNEEKKKNIQASKTSEQTKAPSKRQLSTLFVGPKASVDKLLKHILVVEREDLLNTDIDSPYLIEIQRQKGRAYYLENCWVICIADGLKPLQPENPYFPYYLPSKVQVPLVKQLARLAILKKDLALYAFEHEKQALEKTFNIQIDQPVGIFSYYASWLVEHKHCVSHTSVFEQIKSNYNEKDEEIFRKWTILEAVKIPSLTKQAQLCRDAFSKDLLRQGGDLDLLETIRGKAYVTSLDHPTAYVTPLFNYFTLL